MNIAGLSSYSEIFSLGNIRSILIAIGDALMPTLLIRKSDKNSPMPSGVIIFVEPFLKKNYMKNYTLLNYLMELVL